MSLTSLIAASELGDAPLVKLRRLIDWRPIEAALPPLGIRPRRGGPQPYDPASLFRALLLMEWHKLSYGGLSRALNVRLDFQVFAGFEPGFPVPSASVLCRARLRLKKEGGLARCLDFVATQLDAAGIEIVLADGALRDIRLALVPR